MDFVMDFCDSVTVLDYGTVVAAGPPDIIRADPGCWTPTSAPTRYRSTAMAEPALVVDGLVAG